MNVDAGASRIAALLADPGRCAMVAALLGGRALPAGALAHIARVSPQTGSSHLAKLLQGGLLTVHLQGRHRYYAIAGAGVAQAVEALSVLAPPPAARSLTQSFEARRLAAARTCFDHLAGRLAVDIADALVARGDCVRHDGGFELTRAGRAFFERAAIDAPAFSRTCIDWTERRQHIAGPLGKAMLQVFLEQDFIRRGQRPREVAVTREGAARLFALFGITIEPARAM